MSQLSYDRCTYDVGRDIRDGGVHRADWNCSLTIMEGGKEMVMDMREMSDILRLQVLEDQQSALQYEQSKLYLKAKVALEHCFKFDDDKLILLLGSLTLKEMNDIKMQSDHLSSMLGMMMWRRREKTGEAHVYEQQGTEEVLGHAGKQGYE